MTMCFWIDIYDQYELTSHHLWSCFHWLREFSSLRGLLGVIPGVDDWRAELLEDHGFSNTREARNSTETDYSSGLSSIV